MVVSMHGNSDPGESRRPPWLPMGVLFLFCLLIVAILLTGYCQQVGVERYLYGVDFRSFYAAGRILLDGRGAQLYDPATQYAAQREIVALDDLSQTLLFFNPPFTALPLMLVALFPYPVAYLIWAAINVLLLVVICYLELELLAAAPAPVQYAAVAASVFFLPAMVTLLQGQLSFFLLIGFLLSMRAMRAGRDLEAGMWLGLLAIKPQLAVVPALVLLWQRRWRAAGGMVLAGACGVLFSVVAVGWRGFAGWLELMIRAVSWGDQYGIHAEDMYTWRGALYRLLGVENPGAVTAWWLAGVVVALTLLLLAWRRRPAPDSKAFDVQWAALVLILLFTSPHAYLHDLSLLLIPLVLLVRLAVRRRRERRPRSETSQDA